ncbi:hypothetical protein [uncultured Tolumonas sp.]|uniref:hypothetical protein n=1 Tax=uncultured Tolumonas sp. TaxID=263765 RepID=UPI00292EF052|nr:hypothetical protein [uncultured Tolumonas sp.]
MNQQMIHTAVILALIAFAGPASRLEARPDDGPPLAWTAETEEVSVPVGFYFGTCSSPVGSTGTLPFRAEVVRIQGKNLARLVCSQPGDACYEDWIWDDASLVVTRHTFYPGSRRPDGRHEEVSQLRGYLSGGCYRVTCQDPAGVDCGMGLPSGSYLTIANTGDGFRCEIWQPQAMGQPGQMALLRTFAFDRPQ